MSTTLTIGIALTKILLRAGGQGDLATTLGDGKDAAASLLTMLRRRPGLDAVSSLIASQLDEFLTVEFRQADENDRTAAITEATEVLQSALADEQRLVDAVIEPQRLREYLEENGAPARRASLGGDSGAIFNLLLDFSVDWIARHATKSEVFSSAATARLLRITDNLAATTAETKESVAELQQSLLGFAARAHLNPTANDEIERYASSVAALAPPFLLGRTKEMAALEQFALLGPGQWWGFEGAAQAGKTALMSTFCLNPPPGVVIVPFFVRNNQATANDRAAFLARVLPYLAHLSGQDSATVDLNVARAEDSFQKLLHSAAKMCSERGTILLLLIDALDEDAYNIDRSRTKPSIAGILPPDLPAGVRVVISTRPNPPLPRDVPESYGKDFCHPLRDRTIWRSLDSSPHARAAFSLSDVHELMLDQPGKDIAAFLAASGGQLTISDLAELTACDVSAIDKVITTSPGRMLLPDRSGQAVSYSLGHALITQMVLSILEPKLLDTGTPDQDDSAAWNELNRRVLSPWRFRIHSWAKTYASRDWPDITPSYLMDDAYIALLAENPEFHSDLVGVLVSDSRIGHLYTRHDDTHYPTITQLRRATTRLIEWAGNEGCSADLYHVGKLVAVQNDLATHKGKVPVTLPAVFGALGKHSLATNIALSIPKASDRLEALTQLVETLAKSGQHTKALEALKYAKSVLQVVTDPREQSQARLQIAVAMAQAGRVSDAVAVAAAVKSSAGQAVIFAAVARALAAAGDMDAGRRIALRSKSIAERVSDSHPTHCMAPAALALAEVGMAEEARAAALVARTRAELVPQAAFRVRVLGTTALAFAKSGHQREAVDVAQQALDVAISIANWNSRGRSLAVVAQTFVDIGLEKTALDIASGISDRTGRARALATVAQALATNGQTRQAYKAAQAARRDAADIDKPAVRSRILATPALALTISGHLDEAQAATQEADAAAVDTARATSRASSQTAAARAIDAAGHNDPPSDARLIAAAIENGRDRVSALVQVARVLAEAGHPLEAYKAATDASAQAKVIATKRDREHALAAVAEAYAFAGFLSQARETVETITEPGTSTRGMVSVAEALSRVGRYEDAHLAITEARHYAASIVHPDAKAHATASISLALSANGFADEAYAAAIEAHSAAATISESTGRAGALSQVALAFAAAGNADEARVTAHEAYDVGKGVSSRVGRAKALAHTAHALMAGGQVEASRMAATAARDEAVLIRRSSQRPTVLQQVAQALAATGCIAEANEVAGSISNYQSRAKAYAQIAEVLANADRMTEATNALARSWVAAGTVLESWALLIDIGPDVAHRLVAEALIDS